MKAAFARPQLVEKASLFALAAKFASAPCFRKRGQREREPSSTLKVL